MMSMSGKEVCARLSGVGSSNAVKSWTQAIKISGVILV